MIEADDMQDALSRLTVAVDAAGELVSEDLDDYAPADDLTDAEQRARELKDDLEDAVADWRPVARAYMARTRRLLSLLEARAEEQAEMALLYAEDAGP